MVLTGPTLTLRYATAEDAPRLLELGSDPLVTQWFSWGPYESLEQPEAYIAGLAAKREAGELLDFLIVHRRRARSASPACRSWRRATAGRRSARGSAASGGGAASTASRRR